MMMIKASIATTLLFVTQIASANSVPALTCFAEGNTLSTARVVLSVDQSTSSIPKGVLIYDLGVQNLGQFHAQSNYAGNTYRDLGNGNVFFSLVGGSSATPNARLSFILNRNNLSPGTQFQTQVTADVLVYGTNPLSSKRVTGLVSCQAQLAASALANLAQ